MRERRRGVSTIFGFTSNATAQPVRYVEGEELDWGQPAPGAWEPKGDAVPVVLIPIRSEEKVRAGMDVDTEANKLFFKLVNGEAPFSTRTTLEIKGARYNVKSVSAYNVAGFPDVGIAEVVGGA